MGKYESRNIQTRQFLYGLLRHISIPLAKRVSQSFKFQAVRNIGFF